MNKTYLFSSWPHMFPFRSASWIFLQRSHRLTWGSKSISLQLSCRLNRHTQQQTLKYYFNFIFLFIIKFSIILYFVFAWPFVMSQRVLVPFQRVNSRTPDHSLELLKSCWWRHKGHWYLSNEWQHQWSGVNHLHEPLRPPWFGPLPDKRRTNKVSVLAGRYIFFQTRGCKQKSKYSFFWEFRFVLYIKMFHSWLF